MRQPCRLAAGCLATEPSRRLFDRPGCVLGARDPLTNRIAACLPNDLPIVVAFHGAMRLGAICVGIPTALSTPEKLRLLSHCDPQLLLTDPQTASQLAEENSPAQPLPPVLIADPAGLSDNWGPALAARHRAPTVNIDPHAPAGIAYTSGTTGSPKGIVHSQHNLLLPGAMLVTTRNYGPQLRKGDCLPLTILNLMALTTFDRTSRRTVRAHRSPRRWRVGGMDSRHQSHVVERCAHTTARLGTTFRHRRRGSGEPVRSVVRRRGSTSSTT